MQFRLLVLLCMVLCLFSCGNKEKKILIGVSQCSIDEWRDKQNREMLSEAYYHQAEVDIRSCKDDNKAQIKDIKQLIEKGVDVLVVSPNSAKEITPVVEEAYDRGIPVILVDRKINSDKYTAFIGADNYHIGQKVGEYLGLLLKGKGTVYEVQGLQGSTPANERHKGFREALRRFPHIQYLGSFHTRWYAKDALVKMDTVWQRHPHIDAVFTQNDRLAQGVYASAVRNRRSQGLTLIGIDGTYGKGFGIDMVMRQQLTATFIYPTGGEQIIDLAFRILRKQPFQRQTILSTAVVNAGNVHLIDYDNQQIKAQEERINTLSSRISQQFDILNRQEILFYVFGFMLLMSLTFIVFMVQAYRAKDKMSKELKKATHAKLVFFTNVSHDLRTPLSLLSGPIETLMNDKSLTDKQKSLLTLMRKNVQILLRLITEILDFRKYENGKMNLHLSTFILHEKLKEWTSPFMQLAQERHIHFSLNCPHPLVDLRLTADQEKVERILLNLLSNAFKFTPENGTISVTVSAEDKQLILSVYDSGKSILKEKQAQVFDRFFTESVHHDGSGIGLALTKSFVDLHHGQISVESEEGKGCTFIVRLPLGDATVEKETDAVIPSQDTVPTQVQLTTQEASLPDLSSTLFAQQDQPYEENGNPSILLVDDNADILRYLCCLLEEDYQLRTARNGEDGIRLAARLVPDLIICDVMMPGMDGFECCRRWKHTLQTSHIPVILLTACTQDEQQVKGFDCGADSYIAKPFHNEVLKARVKNLLDNRTRLKNLFGQPVHLLTKKKEASPIDTTFMQRLQDVIARELKNAEFNVDNMAEAMNLSRVQLYRKVKALTNYSPVEILRIARLREAERLLSQTEDSISSIAYAVGFTSPSYFTKCYKEYFGKSPKEKRGI